jgi:beta-1,4-mannosyltransferase
MTDTTSLLTRSDGARRLEVLQSFRGSRTTNPYLSQLVSAMPPQVHTSMFSWRRALLGRYDVFHVHWPENLLRGAPGLHRKAVRYLLVWLLIRRWALTRTALVRTLHNTDPHEGGSRAERRALAAIDAAVTLWICLNDSTPLPPTAASRVILHGDYSTWFDDVPREQPVVGRIVNFGLIRPYKGVEHLVGVFETVTEPGLSLAIVGAPGSPEIGEGLARSAARDSRVLLTLEYVSDSVLAGEITRGELIVLPYRSLLNSGALLLALSLARPVLVPDNAVTRALRDEVGHDWVYTYDGELTARVLSATLGAVSGRDVSHGPNLTARAWSTIGEQHFEAYRDAQLIKHPTKGATSHGEQ